MVTVVTSTKRPQMIEWLIDNFSRQNVPEKELIIVLNKNGISLDKWKAANIRVYQMDEAKSLGECLNFGFMQARYDVIAKFDDDDYYSPNYLSNTLLLLKETGASVIGKASIFVYFKKDRLLTLFRPRMHNFFLGQKNVYLAGGTLVIKREVLEKVKFRKLNRSEDIHFQKDCLEQKITLYSGGYQDYVLIRYEEKHGHSWKIHDKSFKKYCKKIAIVDEFEEYVWVKGEEH
ncbi:glycosyltransferase [Mesobacillus campisalis]|uniref:glycosyltransferase n=1 Tax=Mesobacillus campisalis TaxID=1408103 RepID=UPI000699C8D9|nr:glycosyltransferase [Mesobacillus campisalis]